MAKRTVRRPTEDKALANVMRSQKAVAARSNKLRAIRRKAEKEMTQILLHSGNPDLLSKALAFFADRGG